MVQTTPATFNLNVAALQSGLNWDANAVVQVAEFEREFVVLFDDDEDAFLVCVFHKRTLFRAGDFEGVPRFQGGLVEARRAFVKTCVEFV